MKNIIKKSTYFGAFILFVIGIISCEKDFTDIGSGVVSNTKFSTKDTVIDVVVTNAGIENIRTDGLDLLSSPFFGFQGQYLLGAYVNENYENFEASIISQVNITTGLSKVTYSNPDSLRVETSIDTVFLRMPYYATLQSNTSRPIYTLDSVVGNSALPFTLNIYELDTYLSSLNPTDPSKKNTFFSDTEYATKPTALNATENIDFIPTPNDTLVVIKRRNSLGIIYDTDTIRYASSINPDIGLPMAIIPLKKSFAETVFIENYGTSNFESQSAFNNYFRGIMIEAKEKNHLSGEKGGSLISFNLRNSSSDASKNLIEVYYSNTFFKANNEIDTVIKQNHSFQLGGIATNKFNTSNRVYPSNNEVVLQGAAGSEAEVQILAPDVLDNLKAKDWLINDASLTFYVNQSSDTTNIPYRLYLYKEGTNNTGKNIKSQIKDVYTEGEFTFGGGLEYNNNKKDRYTFRITDYISDFLNNTNTYNPYLKLKVFNTSDVPTSPIDTIFTRYNWNPKVVSILNGDKTANGTRRAQLKISYTEKEN